MTTATMSRVILHGCSRCKGDLFFNPDDSEYTCLQCGATRPFQAVVSLRQFEAPRKRAASNLRLLPRPAMEVSDDAA
jgi:hypothetical protein